MLHRLQLVVQPYHAPAYYACVGQRKRLGVGVGVGRTNSIQLAKGAQHTWFHYGPPASEDGSGRTKALFWFPVRIMCSEATLDQAYIGCTP